MIVGFTGTRKGMTNKQKADLIAHIHRLKPSIVRHGGCYGADDDFHLIVRQNLPHTSIIIHPCNLNQRGFCKGDLTLAPIAPLARNHLIVDLSDTIIAAPKGKEELRSGTWATIRYAKKMNKCVIILYP